LLQLVTLLLALGVPAACTSTREDGPATASRDASGPHDAALVEVNDAAPARASDATQPMTADAWVPLRDAGAPGVDAGTTSRLRTTLVNHYKWLQLSASEDPFDDRPDPVYCQQSSDFDYEEFGGEPSLFANTLSCDYLVVAQRSLARVAVGDVISFRLWQSTLTAPAGAEMHLAIWMGDALRWQTRVAIPAEPGLIKGSWTAKVALPAGTRIVFHLHNHGANQYNLLELSAGPATE
jgi:hypothetical protein